MCVLFFMAEPHRYDAGGGGGGGGGAGGVGGFGFTGAGVGLGCGGFGFFGLDFAFGFCGHGLGRGSRYLNLGFASRLCGRLAKPITNMRRMTIYLIPLLGSSLFFYTKTERSGNELNCLERILSPHLI